MEREAACSGFSVAGPASQLLKLASADTVLWALGGEATGVPPTPAMEEQDHACDPSWEPPQPKSRPDSPWSWVRARAWPHANPPPPARLRSADGPCGSCRGSVRPHFSKEVMGAAAPQRLLGWRLHYGRGFRTDSRSQGIFLCLGWRVIITALILKTESYLRTPARQALYRECLLSSVFACGQGGEAPRVEVTGSTQAFEHGCVRECDVCAAGAPGLQRQRLHCLCFLDLILDVQALFKSSYVCVKPQKQE